MDQITGSKTYLVFATIFCNLFIAYMGTPLIYRLIIWAGEDGSPVQPFLKWVYGFNNFAYNWTSADMNPSAFFLGLSILISLCISSSVTALVFRELAVEAVNQAVENQSAND